MVWTKLIHCNLKEAIKPQYVDKVWRKPVISGRYKAMIKKEFRIAGIPWTFEKIPQRLNPRERAPKAKKQLKLRPIRLAQIKKAIEENELKELFYRQERLDNKDYKGLDLALETLIPYKLGALVYARKVQTKAINQIDAAFELPELNSAKEMFEHEEQKRKIREQLLLQQADDLDGGLEGNQEGEDPNEGDKE